MSRNMLCRRHRPRRSELFVARKPQPYSANFPMERAQKCCVAAPIGTRAAFNQPSSREFVGREVTEVETKMHKDTMRRGLLVLAGLAGAAVLSGGALAADLKAPVYKAPPAGVIPAAYDWTGFYV